MNSSELCQEMRKLTGDTVVLMFSRGKESICCYYQLKKYFEKIHLVYKYGVPGLKFVEDSLRYFENKWQTKIHQIPSPSFYNQINKFMWQTPESALEIMKLGLPTHTNQIYDKFIAKDLGCPGAYRAIGVRANDSPIRRYVIDRHSPINNKQKSFYPIFDWTNEDIRNCLKENEVDLPIDYKIWGKSLDGIDYRFIKPMKEHLPEDYDQVKRFFPLVDLEIMRYEQI